MPTAAKTIDTTLYPETDDMGEGELQRLIAELLRPLLAGYLAARDKEVHVGANQFIYYERFNTAKRTAPDIYVLSGVPQSMVSPSWKLWEMPAPPIFCLEIVSRDVGKDYDVLPPIHSEIGTRELIIFDPAGSSAGARRRTRHGFQVHRRTKRGLYLIEQSAADRVYAKELGCWLRVTGKGEAQRLRVATGENGEHLVPTDAERVQLECAEKERERAEKERERAEKERERAEKEHERAEKERERAEKERERATRIELEAEVARLRRELEGSRRRR